MADRSQYLAQALQAMQAPTPDAQPTGPSLQQMQQVAQQRQAWEAANPGQSYMAHGFQQMGANIAQAPQNLMAAPGQAMGGLQRLAQSFRGMADPNSVVRPSEVDPMSAVRASDYRR